MDIAIRVEDFRCFAKPEPVSLKPMTVLVGENSSGKSSFMAATRLAMTAVAGESPLEFNEAPFNLGSFDQIAHYRGGKAGRAKCFRLGVELSGLPRPRANEKAPEIITLDYWFRGHGAQAELQRQELHIGKDFIIAEVSDSKGLGVRFGVAGEEGRVDFEPASLPARLDISGPMEFAYLLFRMSYPPYALRKAAVRDERQRQIIAALERRVAGLQRSFRERPVALSPIRSRPLRTYQPTSGSPAADGSHVPLVLAKHYFDDRKKWDSLKKIIDAFGKASGMFDAIDLKPLGKHESDPFQLRLKLGGALVNIMDVGYGVSQVLPIVVQAALADRNQVFLVQQPEVHLHPKAQAELATFLVAIMKKSRVKFVVETHSDYFLNRLLIEAREGRIPHDSVNIAFFSREGRESRVDQIFLDKSGNLTGVPSNYREFFLSEEDRFLGL